MSVPAYPSYKDCDIPRLGEIPSHWSVAPLKRLLDIQNGADHKSVEADEGYPVIGSGGAFAYASQYIYDGEAVLLGRKGTIDKPLYIFGKFWTVDTMYWSKIRSGAHGKFAFYAALTIPFGFYSTNTALPSMTKGALGAHSMPIPTFEEQATIAAFLDRETAKIDALVEEQQRLIALLKEKRQAVISRAVTKGLNPDAPMKDSGIEWLGEVPAHWEVGPVKRYARVLPGYAFSAADFSNNPADWRLLRGINISPQGLRWNEETVYWERAENDAMDGWELTTGDIVIGMDRPWIGDGIRAAMIAEEDLPCLLLQRVASLRANEFVDGQFLLRCFQHDSFFHHCAPDLTGVSVPHLSGGQIEDFRIPMPPRDEGGAIADYIEQRVGEFQLLIDEGHIAIALLQERRAALISAAVTGKIDVRGLGTQQAEAA